MFTLWLLLVLCYHCSLFVGGHCSDTSHSSLPIVGLSYELHQATFNSSGQYYNCSNVRYAAPPIRNMRFLAPTSPTGRGFNNGSKAVTCHQAIPTWTAYNADWLVNRTVAFNISAGYHPPNLTTLSPADPTASEDYLFLDVMVPKAVYDQAGRSDSGAPVMVWIHGGGYTLGSKTLYSPSAAGLIKASQSNHKEGVIWVAMNYRLGAFGKLPFQRAIVQSLGFQMTPSSTLLEGVYQSFLTTAGVSNLQAARGLSTEALQLVNYQMVGESFPYGTFTFSKYSLNNADEFYFPTITSSAINYISKTLYPPIFDGSYGYTSYTGRSALWITEAFFTCSTKYLAHSYGNETFNYWFTVYPSLHGDDIWYTHSDGPSPLVQNDTLAVIMQEYFANFATTGNPNGPGLPMFEVYGGEVWCRILISRRSDQRLIMYRTGDARGGERVCTLDS